jgi:hypothetical protein
MNLNVNPKVLHLASDAVQILGILGTVLSFPGVSIFAPWAGIASGVATGIATVIKTQVIGNIPAKPGAALTSSS